jgi:DNA primase
LILDLIQLIEDDLGEPVKKSDRWLFWNCPFHDDRTPSFGVNREGKRYFCFGCRKSGNVNTWLKEYRKMNVQGNSTNQPVHKPTPTDNQPPNEQWQCRARLYIDHWEKMLWSERGREIRWYLNRRGLNDEILHSFHIGYNTAHFSEGMHLWGLTPKSASDRVFLSAGVIIPWIIDGTIWKVNIRRFEQDPKYLQIRGSQPGLFGAENMAGKPTVFLVEGEFDAMLLHQEAGDLVGVGTFGSASIREIDYRWVSRLLSSQRIFIMGDSDKAGREFMSALSGFSHRFRCVQVPSGKDVTEYWQSGENLREWINHLVNADKH